MTTWRKPTAKSSLDFMSKDQVHLALVQIEAYALAVDHLERCLGVDVKSARGLLKEFWDAGLTEPLAEDLSTALESARKRPTAPKITN